MWFPVSGNKLANPSIKPISALIGHIWILLFGFEYHTNPTSNTTGAVQKALQIFLHGAMDLQVEDNKKGGNTVSWKATRVTHRKGGRTCNRGTHMLGCKPQPTATHFTSVPETSPINRQV